MKANYILIGILSCIRIYVYEYMRYEYMYFYLTLAKCFQSTDGINS